MSIQKIGIIGLGIMGKPMAANLLEANYEVGIYVRNPNSIAGFGTKKFSIYKTPAELAKHTDLIITMVSDSSDVTEVLTGLNGVIHGAHAGHLLIDMSTISPEVSRQLAQQFEALGVDILDAPVSGGEQGAMDATLSIMVGGKLEAFTRALPIFKCLGKNIIHVGDHGAGQVAKACNQILVAQTMSAVAEAFLLAKSSGVDAKKVREALLGGFAYSKILEVHGKRMLDNTYQPGFKARLHHKDLGIALHSASENKISIPGTEIVADYMRKIVEHGDGELDSAAIAKVVFSEI